jgi:hypothetical protein
MIASYNNVVKAILTNNTKEKPTDHISNHKPLTTFVCLHKHKKILFVFWFIWMYSSNRKPTEISSAHTHNNITACIYQRISESVHAICMSAGLNSV